MEEQIEDFKDSVSRDELLRLADQVIDELRVSEEGQYQLTELLLCEAVDRRILKMLRLPGFRAWCAAYQAQRSPLAGEPLPDIPEPLRASV